MSKHDLLDALHSNDSGISRTISLLMSMTFTLHFMKELNVVP